MKYLIFICFYIIINLIGLNNGQTLPSYQSDAAQVIITALSGSNTNDLCVPSGMFTCSVINGFKTVTGITLPDQQSQITISQSLASFPDLEYLSVGNLISFTPNLFTTIGQLSKLASIVVETVNSAIPSGFTLPDSLSDLSIYKMSVPVPNEFFTGRVAYLTIETVSTGFLFPSTLPNNEYLLYMYFPICPTIKTLPSNINTAFPNFQYLYMNIENDKNVVGYSDYVFPTIPSVWPASFSDLSLFFINSKTNIQTWPFPESLANVQTPFLHISDNGFTFDNDSSFNLAGLPIGVTIELNNQDILTQCQAPCLDLPVDSRLTIRGSSFNLANLDFTNIAYFDITGNTLSQPLPTLNINYQRIKSLSLTSNEFTGSIPEEYCQLPANSFNLKNNKLTSVPNCFKCVGANKFGTPNLFPNTFTDGFTTSSTPSTCPTLQLGNIDNLIIKTKSIKTLINISGTDIGWDYQLVSPIPSPISPYFNITIPNKQATITIPQSAGANKSLVVKVGATFQVTKTFTYSFEVPVLSSLYTIVENQMIIKGTGFDYVNSNSVKINEFPYNFYLYKNDPEYEYLAIPLSIIDIITDAGQPINVQVSSGGQLSNTVQFIFLNPISMTPVPLYININSIATFPGSYGTDDKSLVTKFTIGGLACTVDTLSTTSLVFLYPPLSSGEKQLIIVIGGQEYNTTVMVSQNIITLPPTTLPITATPITATPITAFPIATTGQVTTASQTTGGVTTETSTTGGSATTGGSLTTTGGSQATSESTTSASESQSESTTSASESQSESTTSASASQSESTTSASESQSESTTSESESQSESNTTSTTPTTSATTTTATTSPSSDEGPDSPSSSSKLSISFFLSFIIISLLF